ncbi:hypothetical protein [Tatumella sp. JGM118]|nr:hypothetical protein [Tatumella sp. JGM118]
MSGDRIQGGVSGPGDGSIVTVQAGDNVVQQWHGIKSQSMGLLPGIE